MRFVRRSDVHSRLEGRSVAIVGSGPGVMDNAPGFIDGHDVVVRVNNYKLLRPTGYRTDIYYSFFGRSIRKSSAELINDGVTLCMCKCPDAHAIQSDWHARRGKMLGVDYREHYERRKVWWFCDTYIPSVEDFMVVFDLLGRHIPTTGFAAIHEVLQSAPRQVYLTGFDGFKSGIHNVDEPWRDKNRDDPIRHVPALELKWLADNLNRFPITCDSALRRALGMSQAA